MDLDLAAEPGRAAGTDAERRAALALARALRAQGRDATTETHWVRPGWPLVQALCALVAVAGSVASVDHPRVGVGLVLGALAGSALDLLVTSPLRLLAGPARATQTVVSPAPRAKEVNLVLTAAIDGARGGTLRRLPAPELWQLGALLLLAVFCAARVAGAEGVVLGAVQLVPTAVLILLVGGWVDHALAPVDRDASAPAVVLEVVRALDRTPPRHLGVEVVLAGAGGVRGAGLRRWVGRDGRPAQALALIHVAPCATGTPVWLRPCHRQLERAAHQAAASEARLGARPVRGRTAASGVRRPAISIATRGTAEGGPRAAAELVLALVAALDAELHPAD